MIRSTLLLSLPLVLLGFLQFLGGCASASLEIGVTTRAETYREIGDRVGLLTSDPPRCAAIPTIMTSTSPGRGVAADFAFDKAMAKDYRPFSLVPQDKTEPFTVISNDVVMNQCIDLGRLETLRSLMSTTQPGNCIDTKPARELGEILNVEYLFVPQIVALKTDNASRFSFTGLTFIRTGWISVEGTLQLWHAPTGRLIWQSTGEGALTAENVVGISPPTQAAFDALFSTLVGDFVSGRSASVVSGKVNAPPSANPTNTTASSGKSGTNSVESAAKTMEADGVPNPEPTESSPSEASAAPDPVKDTPKSDLPDS